MTPEPTGPVARLLDQALERGIVTAEQHRSLGALQRELADDDARARTEPADAQPMASAMAATPSQPAPATAPTPVRETLHGLNSVTVAYIIGAMLVVFASVWFLVERWDRLGVWGVLLVTGGYVAILFWVRAWLDQRGFRLAASIALMLVVTLTPVLAWSVENVIGFWPAGTRSEYIGDSSRPLSVQWVVVDVASLLVAIGLIRWRPSVALTIPMTVLLWALGFHLSSLIATARTFGASDRWLMLTTGMAILTVAGEVDRWQARRRASGARIDGDYAFFFWLGGLIAFFLGYMTIWLRAGDWRHNLLGVAVALIVASLYVRRRTHLVFGLLALFGYLGYLALDVFKAYVSLPIALAVLGLLLILTTVWMQRRFPRLVARVNAERGGKTLPPIVTWGPLIFAVVMSIRST